MEISLASYPSILFDKKPEKALTISWCTGNIWCVHTGGKCDFLNLIQVRCFVLCQKTAY